MPRCPPRRKLPTATRLPGTAAAGRFSQTLRRRAPPFGKERGLPSARPRGAAISGRRFGRARRSQVPDSSAVVSPGDASLRAPGGHDRKLATEARGASLPQKDGRTAVRSPDLPATLTLRSHRPGPIGRAPKVRTLPGEPGCETLTGENSLRSGADRVRRNNDRDPVRESRSPEAKPVRPVPNRHIATPRGSRVPSSHPTQR
jgi:hypothetical protein